MSRGPYVGKVADLVDPYLTREMKVVGGFTGEGNTAIWWMRRHPGRWALVGEGNVGLSRQLLDPLPDVEVKVLTSRRYNADGIERTYARVPHPKGESLEDCLARRQLSPNLFLPAVGRDEFNWTKAELEDACWVARENLFPTGS